MKRFMSLVVGIALVVAGCASTDTSDSTVAGGAQTTAATTAVVPTTAGPAATLAATTTSEPTTTVPAPPPPSPTTAAPAATTTTAPTTTAAPTAVYEVPNPHDPAYFPPSQPGAAPLFGSGCSPGAGNLPNGIWFGEITNVGLTSFDFDLMCFAPNPPGSTEEDGIGDITNSNPTLRAVPVNASAHVYVLDAAMNWMDMAYQTWSAAPTLGNGCPPGCQLDAWIYVNGGEATEITMIWTP